MKKSLIFTCCIFFSVLLFSQKWQIAPIVGVNIPNKHFTEPEGLIVGKRKKASIKHTAAIGFGLRYKMNRYLSLRTELFYEERGWYSLDPFAINPITGESEGSKLDYFYPFITLPLLFEGNIGKKWQLFANTGINTSRRIGGKIKTETGNIPTGFIFPEDKKPIFDFGYVFGFGLKTLAFRKMSWQFEYRHYRSWTKLGVGYSIENILRHKGYLLNLSCYFKLK
jgi:Outer membrane protein beta-barrel domain